MYLDDIVVNGGIDLEVPGKLVIGKELDDRYLRMIKNEFPDMEISICADEEEQDRSIVDADILLTRIIPKDPYIAPNLKWVHFLWEGVDSMSSEFKDSDISLTNSSGAHTVHIAEHVFMLLLSLARRSRMYFGYQEGSKWLGWFHQPRLDKLKGSTIGIMGYGRIGRAVAKIANGFGMDVIVLKKDPGVKVQDSFHSKGCCDMDGEIPSQYFGPGSLHEMLPLCDHVVLSLPLTNHTRGIIGREEFRIMKDSAFFINIGRGSLVDEDALIDALRMGEIKGAGLDVFIEEPLPSENPLWEMDNVIITPHSSVGGDPADDDVIDLFIENLHRFIDGRKLINLVDKKTGY